MPALEQSSSADAPVVAIDIHTHMIPESGIAELGRSLPDLAPVLTRSGDHWEVSVPHRERRMHVPAGMFDTEQRLADMDRQGVDVHLLSVSPSQFRYWLEDVGAAVASARILNDSLLATAASAPDRFLVLGTLPMQSPSAAIEEIGRLAATDRVCGVQLGTNVVGRNLDHPDLAPVWAALAAADMAVVLHPDHVLGADRLNSHYLANLVGNPAETTLAAGALMFGGVLRDNPELRVALLHGGGFLPYQIGRFEHGWSVRAEPQEHGAPAPREQLRSFFVDSLTHDPLSLKFLVERLGHDRVCLGSDYPFDMGDPEPVLSVNAALGETERHGVLTTGPQAFVGARWFRDRA